MNNHTSVSTIVDMTALLSATHRMTRGDESRMVNEAWQLLRQYSEPPYNTLLLAQTFDAGQRRHRMDSNYKALPVDAVKRHEYLERYKSIGRVMQHFALLGYPCAYVPSEIEIRDVIALFARTSEAADTPLFVYTSSKLAVTTLNPRIAYMKYTQEPLVPVGFNLARQAALESLVGRSGYTKGISRFGIKAFNTLEKEIDGQWELLLPFLRGEKANHDLVGWAREAGAAKLAIVAENILAARIAYSLVSPHASWVDPFALTWLKRLPVKNTKGNRDKLRALGFNAEDSEFADYLVTTLRPDKDDLNKVERFLK